VAWEVAVFKRVRRGIHSMELKGVRLGDYSLCQNWRVGIHSMELKAGSAHEG